MISPAPWEIIDLRHQQNGQLKIQSTVDYSHIANVIARTPGAAANALLIVTAPKLADVLGRLAGECLAGSPMDVTVREALSLLDQL